LNFQVTPLRGKRQIIGEWTLDLGIADVNEALRTGRTKGLTYTDTCILRPEPGISLEQFCHLVAQFVEKIADYQTDPQPTLCIFSSMVRFIAMPDDVLNDIRLKAYGELNRVSVIDESKLRWPKLR
jgi:hypothetical protein